MAHQWSRVNLLATEFPMLTALWGETTLITSGDVFNTNFGPDNINKPQAYYMENVMPTSAGYQSIRYIIILQPATGMTNTRYFSQVFKIKVPNPSYTPLSNIPEFVTVTIATTNLGVGIWVSESGSGWVLKNPGITTTLFPMKLSTAFIDGQTYIYMANVGIFHYDLPTHAFVNDTLIGITAANISGITSANGYMIAYGQNSVLWSSLVNPLDFTPSLITGAGGGQVGELKNAIVCCFNISGGFIAYTFDNTVQASYTGNVQFPFKFQEVPGSGGVISQANISWQDSSDTHIVYGTKGFQTINIGSDASQVFPEVTEMLSAGYTEIFDSTNLVFEQIHQIEDPETNIINPLINMVGTRYVVISYNGQLINGPSGNQYLGYDRALIYDRTLSRWGKVVIPHVDCIDNTAINQFTPGGLLPVNEIAFINFDGTYQVVTQQFFKFDGINPDIITPFSTILFGKFQLQRNRGVYLQRVKMENLISTENAQVYIIPTYDGNTFQPAVALTNLIAADESDGPNIATFGGRVYGKNVSVLLTGEFNLSSAQVDLVLGADD
jgi:hypothetical protein